MNKKFVFYNSKSVELLGNAIANKIDDELCKNYWNLYQNELNSPFDNTGEFYSNNYLTIRSYYWGDDDKKISLPNFEAEHIQFRWYKHVNRGFQVYVEEGYESNIFEVLAETLEKSLESITNDFKRKKQNLKEI